MQPVVVYTGFMFSFIDILITIGIIVRTMYGVPHKIVIKNVNSGAIISIKDLCFSIPFSNHQQFS